MSLTAADPALLMLIAIICHFLVCNSWVQACLAGLLEIYASASLEQLGRNALFDGLCSSLPDWLLEYPGDAWRGNNPIYGSSLFDLGMAIRVGQHWCGSLAFPLGAIHLDTVFPVLAILAASIGLISIASDQKLPPGAFWITGGAAVELMASQMDGLTSSQLGGRSWLPIVAGCFVFILGSNWAGALLPLELIRVPDAELHAPTADVNVTAGLALATSHTYFYAGFQTRSIGYVVRYVSPVAYLLPINLLEDFSKPLSLSFRLLGNIMADELTIAVLSSLVAFIVPVAVMWLGIFTSAIQALVFATLAGAYIAESTEIHAEVAKNRLPEPKRWSEKKLG